MSMTQTEVVSRDRASYGGFVDALGGVATAVLTIIGLAGIMPDMMLGIVTIIFGAALLIQGGTMLSEYAGIIFPADAQSAQVDQFGGGTLSVIFLAGAAGIVLGLLALLGVNPTMMASAAVIAFGTALLLSSNSVLNLHVLKRSVAAPRDHQSGGEILAGEMASGSAGIQALAGLTAVVLGILAIVGTGNPVLFSLVALLVLGGTLVLTGTTLSTVVLSFMRPAMGHANS